MRQHLVIRPGKPALSDPYAAASHKNFAFRPDKAEFGSNGA